MSFCNKFLSGTIKLPDQHSLVCNYSQLQQNSNSRNLCQPAKSKFKVKRTNLCVRLSLTRNPDEITQGGKPVPIERDCIRMALPSKGRMAEDTQDLLKSCLLSVYKPNPRQYVASIPQLPGVEVWFQRASDVVRKVRYGDVDLGIVGYDMFCEFAEEDPELVVLHEALDFGHCRLSLGIPMGGKFANINTWDDLKNMSDWNDTNPLRVVTGYQNIARKFFRDRNFSNVMLVSADGALEAAPAMGSADIILDLVSTGVTLRENNLKEIEGGVIMQSEGVLIGNRRSLKERDGLLDIVQELIERLDAHLIAQNFYTIEANMRGNTPEEVAALLLNTEGLEGLQGPTISPVFVRNGDNVSPKPGFYAAAVCVQKKQLYSVVRGIRKAGGSGVLVSPKAYIFNEESPRYSALLDRLGLQKGKSN
eukprot:TRINITY_DN1571_c0_g1_i1.p1 TRINITY_DN1571_c0_g1~~TRINITY_DN1571_c0_g1_i1.p1  ORF type:complete len:420 (-),score=69.54 TRINITY_DN1571_c0_g1_i1:381-1640(-)